MKGTYQSDNDFLLSAVQRGDQKAFDTLFRRYYPMLCAYGHRFVELEDAEEIVEDSLEQACTYRCHPTGGYPLL